MINLDFTKHKAAQDMIEIIKTKKQLSTQDALNFVINEENYKHITATGWASIAVDLWGHGDPDRKWIAMSDAKVELTISDGQLKLITYVMKKEKVDIEEAVSYFLIFTMDSLGYHI